MTRASCFVALPHITPFEVDEDINLGDSVQMNCHISKGDRPVKISWNFNGRALPSGLGITTQKLGDRSSVLTISNVLAHHNGEYTCIAKNGAGVVNYTASVHINGI